MCEIESLQGWNRGDGGSNAFVEGGRSCFGNKYPKLMYFTIIFSFSRIPHTNLQLVGDLFAKLNLDPSKNALFVLIERVPSIFRASQIFT